LLRGRRAASPAAQQERGPIARALLDALLATADFELRMRIIQALGQLADPAAVEPLGAAAVHDGDDVLRAEATRSLGQLPGEVATRGLVAAARDPSPRVRDAAVTALGKRNGAEVGATLSAALQGDRWMFVRRDAAQALAEGCPSDRFAALRTAAGASAEDEDVRRAALAALVRCHDAGVTRLLVEILGRGDEDVGLRQQACALLGAAGDRAALPELVGWIRRLGAAGPKGLPLRVSCTRALGRLAAAPAPDAQAEALLVELLASDHPPLQIAAAEALGQICSGRSLSALEQAGRAAAPHLRVAAQKALARCRAPGTGASR
jgi:HEAT repeat protein